MCTHLSKNNLLLNSLLLYNETMSEKIKYSDDTAKNQKIKLN